MSGASSIHCSSCGSSLLAVDIAPGGRWIECGYCGSLTKPPWEESAPISEPAVQAAKLRPLPPIAPQPDLPMPEGVSLKQGKDDVEISRSWQSPMGGVLAVFLIGWVFFLKFWFSRVLDHDSSSPLFTTLMVVIGIGLLYGVVSNFLSATRITINRSAVTVMRWPFNWDGTLEIASSNICRVSCEKVKSSGLSSSSVTYEIWIMRNDGSKVQLVAGGDMPEDHALYIQQEIRHALRALPKRETHSKEA